MKEYRDSWIDHDKQYSRTKKKHITAGIAARTRLKLLFGSKQNKHREGASLLSAALIADLHVDGDTYRGRNNTVREGLAAISCYKKFDAVIIAGDITNSAHVSEYENLKQYLKTYNRVKTILPEMGNHDTRATSIEPYYDEALALFRDFCIHCGIDMKDTAYYAADLCGCRVLSLASEGIVNTDQAVISDTQLAWLDRELTEAAKRYRPIFVICHQPPLGRNGAVGGGSIGSCSEELEKILLAHASPAVPILYISGHMHVMREVGFESPAEGLYYLNLHTFMYSKGMGFCMDVYENRIVLEGCNFITREKIEGYRYEIPCNAHKIIET